MYPYSELQIVGAMLECVGLTVSEEVMTFVLASASSPEKLGRSW
jgi:hypothetical protein